MFSHYSRQFKYRPDLRGLLGFVREFGCLPQCRLRFSAGIGWKRSRPKSGKSAIVAIPMLFYTQLKREFTRASWKRGQLYFREERVSEVKLNGDVITAKVQGTDPKAYETAIVTARGTIANSKCSCPAHRVYETHCKHVAALAIWTVERGSLLRAGVTSGNLGVAPGENEIVLKDPRAISDVRLRKLIMAHPVLTRASFIIRRDLMAGSVEGKDLTGHPFSIPITLVEAAALLEYAQTPDEEEVRKQRISGEAVLFVRGIFQSKVFSAISAESAIRYRDPETKTIQVITLSYLLKQSEPGLWKTNQGLLLELPPAALVSDEDVSFIQQMNQSKVIYQGQAALDNLAKLLTHRNRDQIVFDHAVRVEVDSVPLRLVSLNIGRKVEKSRVLTFEFANGNVRLNSAELEELAKYGRLSAHYAWVGDRIYRLSTSLTQLQQYANRSGVAAKEDDEKPEQAGRASAFGALHDDATNPLHPLAAYRLSLELGVENFQVDADWEEFQEWRKVFEKNRTPPLPQARYGFRLRGYQENGLKWLWSLYHRGLSALLADEMGLGKTHQVLALLTTLYKAKRTSLKQPSIVVAPTSVIAAWVQKLNKYDTGLKWHVFHGSGRSLPHSGVDLVLTTYGILHREPGLRDRDWHVVILDEAQMIKNSSTISARASRSLKSKFRIAMTGTPIENQSTDLWSIMEFLLPGYLGSLPRFKRLYGWGREMPPEAQAAALRRMVSPFLLRRTKAQVLTELPEKTEEIVECEMTALQKKIYRSYLNSADATRIRENLSTGGKVDYANVLALLTRLKQVCDHPKLPQLTSGELKLKKGLSPLDTGKWEAFQELLNEALGSQLKVVVFTQYLGMIDLISRYLKSEGIGHTELRGDTPDRTSRLEQFASDPECKVFLCSLLAGGLGIDLTAASVCIHFDRWWNPAKENQATDRLHRIGQTRGVQVFKLQIPESVEERIASIIQSKLALSGALIEESSLGLKSFSRKELLKLLAPPEQD